MRERGNEEVLSKDEVFDRSPLICSIIDHDVRKDCNARQGIRYGLCVFWLEIEKLSFVADEREVQGSEVGGIFIKPLAQGGELWLILRGKMIAAL